MKSANLHIYCLDQDVKIPQKATSGAAAFDIRTFLSLHETVNVCNHRLENFDIEVESDEHGTQYIVMPPWSSAMVPTGIKMNIPDGYSVRFHPRSGNSHKRHLVLANQEAVIDSDYIDEVFVLLYNMNSVEQMITEGQRICQAELIQDNEYYIEETEHEPVKKTEREGGLGHTGDH